MPVGIDAPGNIDGAEPIPEGANGIGCRVVLHNHAYPEGAPAGERHRKDAIKLSIEVRNGSNLPDESVREEVVLMGRRFPNLLCCFLNI